MSTAAAGRHRAPVTAVAAAASGHHGEHAVGLSPSVEVLLEAVLAVSADLDLEGVLRRTVEGACLLTGAPHGMIAVNGERAILYGQRASGQPLPGTGLVAPVVVAGESFGRLHLAVPEDSQGFTLRDELMVERLVCAAEQAIGNALAHQESQTPSGHDIDAAVRVERERVARDLHDTVIQQLFASGLQLQALRRSVEESAGDAITAVVRDLDAAMKDLRATIYGLRRRRQVSVLGEVQALLEEYAAGLGFRPRLEHSGPVDALLEGDLGDHVLATLREALSNMVKHARATAAAVELHVSPAWAMLRVRDNGIGIPVGEAGVLGSGLTNLRVRAERLGGVLRIDGSQLDWIVPTAR